MPPSRLGGPCSLQLVFFSSALTDVTFQHVETLPVMDRVVPVVSWQVLLLFKPYAGGPQDMVDTRQILKLRQPRADDLRQIAEMAESLGLLKEWTALLNLHQAGD